MVSTYTPNINLEEPARGDQVGTWDTPVNSNMTLVDLVAGGIASITLNNSPVVLSAAQFQAANITFSSTLTGSVAITFPSTFKKSYEIQNLCTGSSAFVITLGTTAAGGQVICCPFGEITEVLNDGTNLKFKNLGRIGSYWDYAGSSVPAWVSGCTVPPYLNCDGTAFSAVTYPTLAVILGGTTLPDSRGSARYTLNQTTGRLTSATGGVDGNTLFAAKTTQTNTIVVSNLPSLSHIHGLTCIPGGSGVNGLVLDSVVNGVGVNAIRILNGGHPSADSADPGGTSVPLGSIGTAYIGGLSLIRSA